MKKLLFIGIVSLLFLFLAGCGTDDETDTEQNTTTTDTETGCSLDYIPICGDDGLTYQNSCFSSLRDVGVAHTGVCSYNVCSFNGQDHYIMDNMLYYEDDRGRPYIAVLYGMFNLQADGDGWTYVRAINKDASYYVNRMLEYDLGVTESGNAITCSESEEAPEQLKDFLKTHGKIIELKIQGYEEANETVAENVTE